MASNRALTIADDAISEHAGMKKEASMALIRWKRIHIRARPTVASIESHNIYLLSTTGILDARLSESYVQVLRGKALVPRGF